MLMQRSALLLLLSLAAFTTAATAQQVQTGLLYWCSFVEGGSNYAIYPTSPRTTWLGYSSGSFSAPCHMPYSTGVIAPQWTDAVPYVYSNGTDYPYTDITLKVAPSSCLVRTCSCLTTSLA